MELIE